MLRCECPPHSLRGVWAFSLPQFSFPGAAGKGGRGETGLYKQPWLHCEPKPQVPSVLTHSAGPRADPRLPEPAEISLHHSHPETHTAPGHSMCSSSIKVHRSLSIDQALLQRQNHTAPQNHTKSEPEQLQEMVRISPMATRFILTYCFAVALLPTQIPA